VYLHQSVDTDANCQLVESIQLFDAQGGGNQQHRIGTHQPGIADVTFAHREVLADHRKIHSTAGRTKIRC